MGVASGNNRWDLGDRSGESAGLNDAMLRRFEGVVEPTGLEVADIDDGCIGHGRCIDILTSFVSDLKTAIGIIE